MPLWIALGALALGGAGAGVYFATRSPAKPAAATPAEPAERGDDDGSGEQHNDSWDTPNEPDKWGTPGEQKHDGWDSPSEPKKPDPWGS
jgi:hypothetical protein